MTQVREVAAVEYEVQPRTVFIPPVYYPEADGKPMAETDTHRKQMTYTGHGHNLAFSLPAQSSSF